MLLLWDRGELSGLEIVAPESVLPSWCDRSRRVAHVEGVTRDLLGNTFRIAEDLHHF